MKNQAQYSIGSIALLLICLLGYQAFAQHGSGGKDVRSIKLIAPPGKAIAAFAEGCFWHSEIIFEDVVGVDSAVSGYAGGNKANPTYEDVSTGQTGHTETVLVYYNPKVISYAELLRVFYASHNNKQINGQGNDRGTQYRSVAFYLNANEQQQATAAKKQLNAVTQVLPLTAFYRAENYHQNYISHNKNNGYVQAVSIPDYNEFVKTYKGKLKGNRY